MLTRKHPKKIRAERKLAKQKREYAEISMFDIMAEQIAIEIDREIIEDLKKIDAQKKITS